MKSTFRVFLCAAAVFATVGLSAVPSGAVMGWLIDEIDADFPEDSVRSYYAGKSVRIENLIIGLDFILDLEKGIVFAVDDAGARYAGGAVADVTEELTVHMTARRKSRGLAGVDERASAVMSDLRFEKIADEKQIAGFAAGGYRIFLGELLVEELWLAPGIDAATAGAGGTLFLMMESVTGGEGGDNDEFPSVYEKEKAYRDLLKSGYPVRRIRYFLDIEALTEVVGARRSDLPEALFSVPSGFERVDYLKLFSGRK